VCPISLLPVGRTGVRSVLEDTAFQTEENVVNVGILGTGNLGRAGVRAFEEQHRVVLPEPYRTFVAEVADGSASGPPEYGMVPLRSLPAGWGEGRAERSLGEPFPLTGEWQWDGDARPYDEIGPLVDRVADHGSVVLGTEGCGMNWHLVVTGPHRGHIWLITDVGAMPFGAEFGFTSGRPGFAGWVGHWAAGRSWFDLE
jgi:hypothetical protein